MVRLAAVAAWTFVLLGATCASARPANVSDFAICNNEAASGAPAASPKTLEPERGAGASPSPHVAPKTPEAKPEPGAAGSSGMASGTDSTGKLVAGARDPLLEGLAADRADDPAYQQAYRECMTRRGVTGRPTS